MTGTGTIAAEGPAIALPTSMLPGLLCPACHIFTDAFPLCSLCERALRPEPQSTPIEGPISRHHTLFRAEGWTYDVLKAWKKRPGLLLDRRILREIQPGLWPELTRAQAILPIPQDWRRSFALSGSPAFRLARALSAAFTLPLHTDLLQSRSGQRQAEQAFRNRIERNMAFDVRADSGLQCVLLVDDFKTTGQTLRQAAIALRNSGIPEIQSWTLGTRPRTSRPDSKKTPVQTHRAGNGRDTRLPYP